MRLQTVQNLRCRVHDGVSFNPLGPPESPLSTGGTLDNPTRTPVYGGSEGILLGTPASGGLPLAGGFRGEEDSPAPFLMITTLSSCYLIERSFSNSTRKGESVKKSVKLTRKADAIES